MPEQEADFLERRAALGVREVVHVVALVRENAALAVVARLEGAPPTLDRALAELPAQADFFSISLSDNSLSALASLSWK